MGERGRVTGKFISSEVQERLERLMAAYAEVGEVLERYELTVPDIYREYVFRARGSSDKRFGVNR